MRYKISYIWKDIQQQRDSVFADWQDIAIDFDDKGNWRDEQGNWNHPVYDLIDILYYEMEEAV